MNTRRARAMHCKTLLVLGMGLFASATALAGSCSVSSGGLAFGTYQPLTFPGKLTSADKTSTATISVVCSGIVTGGSYSIGLGAGHFGPGNGISTRYLNNVVNGGDFMAVNAYTEGTYATVWGDGNNGTLLGGSIPAGNSNASHTIYGKIAAGQSTLKAGSYSDTMTMTVTYNP